MYERATYSGIGTLSLVVVVLAVPARLLAVSEVQKSNPLGRHALLVGVTNYEFLKGVHLNGPANDCRAMQQLLQDAYRFPTSAIVKLTEDEGTLDLRPTRANIKREFDKLADRVREGDQVVILLAGHGDRQPESVPPDPHYPEPDGLDEIFLPADIRAWSGFPDRCPNAIIDDDIGRWLDAIIAKRACVWIVFDCCHSGTMTRGIEQVRQLPPGQLVPAEEIQKAKERAAQRQGSRRGAAPKSAEFVSRIQSDYLVATYACRSEESTPESNQPEGSPNGKCHGLLTYSIVDILTKAAAAKTPLTYRELVQRLQVRYAGRPSGGPTPLVEGKGQNRVVLGVDEPVRSPLLLTRLQGAYTVNAGDLYGLCPGTILAVDSAAKESETPKVAGHFKVMTTRPFASDVEPCDYGGIPARADLNTPASCKPVFIDYGLRRFKIAVQVMPKSPIGILDRLTAAMKPLFDDQRNIAQFVHDVKEADWIVRYDGGQLEFVEASGNAQSFPLPDLNNSDALVSRLRENLGKVFRARNLIALAGKFDLERNTDTQAVDLEVEVLDHKGKQSRRSESLPRSTGGWIFRPGDVISFRVRNKSPFLQVDVTLLIVGSNFQISAFYPQPNEVGKTIKPGESLETPPPYGEISKDPPFGTETLVVIAAPPSNPAADFTPLVQDSLPRARGADATRSLRTHLGELLERAAYGSGTRRGLTRTTAIESAMRVLTWRTEPKGASQ